MLYKKILGENIRKKRELLEFTIEELAFRCNLSPSFVGEIERGKKVCSINTLYKIADNLNCSLYELFEFTDKKKNTSKLIQEEITTLLADLTEKQQKDIVSIVRIIVKEIIH